MTVVCVVSGGQSGVDRAALEAALATGVPYGGWCPADGWAEDLPDPPGLLSRFPLLTPTTDRDSSVRTRLNVLEGDATLVLVRTMPIRSPGTKHTVEIAESLQRPLLVTTADDVSGVLGWLARLPEIVLNVAGPRESQDPGVHDAAYTTLCEVLTRLLADDGSVSPEEPPSMPRPRRRRAGATTRGSGSRPP